MQIYQRPFEITKVETKSITGTSQVIDMGNDTVYLHNTGTGKVFISNGTRAATTSDWPLASGEKSAFPITGVFSAISDSTATLVLAHVIG